MQNQDSHAAALLSKYENVIDHLLTEASALKGDARIMATTLADKTAEKFGLKSQMVYYILNALFTEHPDYKVYRGNNGGLGLRVKEETPQ